MVDEHSEGLDERGEDERREEVIEITK